MNSNSESIPSGLPHAVAMATELGRAVHLPLYGNFQVFLRRCSNSGTVRLSCCLLQSVHTNLAETSGPGFKPAEAVMFLYDAGLLQQLSADCTLQADVKAARFNVDSRT
jgi:hypothetical protein